MSGGVFISYRREESSFAARAIYDRVAQRLGRENVFLDVDNIDLGVDWLEVLSERVGACEALIAVIGRNWTSSADRDSRRGVHDPDDFVRIEIEAALERRVRVIPVLVDGARMPRADDLPESLKGLARRQNIEISHIRFDADVEKLIRSLALILVPHPREPISTKNPASQEYRAPSSEPRRELAETLETRDVRRAADQGNAIALANLAFFYRDGRGGLPQDDHEAARFYKLAADQGNAGAQINLGFFYSTGRGGLAKDDREAARLYKLAADQGNADGQDNLGILYRDGRGGLPQDDREAARLFKLAADQGNAYAQSNLGCFYRDGRGGLPKDEHEAARLFKLAAQQG
jgi:hypothetical protein